MAIDIRNSTFSCRAQGGGGGINMGSDFLAKFCPIRPAQAVVLQMMRMTLCDLHLQGFVRVDLVVILEPVGDK